MHGVSRIYGEGMDRDRDIWRKMEMGMRTSEEGPDSHSPWATDGACVMWSEELIFYYF